MAAQEIKPGVYYVGAKDRDRVLFDELIPLPEGTSYNAYLVQGREKTALIDTVDPSKEQVLLGNLKQLNVKKIDYVISNHAEQDHSGSIPKILEIFPDAKVVTNPKCKTFLKDLLLIPDNKFIEVNEGDTLALGGKTLQFLMTPWVHWPETQTTYLIEDRILFSCDFLGAHIADSELFVQDPAKVYESAKRYFAEIMMPFRVNVKKNLVKVRQLQVDIIGASHGQLYPNPDFIMNAYEEWVSDAVRNIVVLPWVSMHGSTNTMVNFLSEELIKRGVQVKPFNLITADVGELAMSLVDAATVVIASPTVLVGPHPAAVYGAYLVNALRPKTRFLSVIGSYSWSGKMVEQLQTLLSGLKAELLEPVIAQGHPKEEHFKALERLAEQISRKHQEICEA